VTVSTFAALVVSAAALVREWYYMDTSSVNLAWVIVGLSGTLRSMTDDIYISHQCVPGTGE
jgi:hypothetical protein